ncbi:MAG: UMP kinase, partial [Deltaproteobacteria bacterium]
GEVLDRGLKFMDATAIALCMEHRLPVIVFDLQEEGMIKRIIRGEGGGSIVH